MKKLFILFMFLLPLAALAEIDDPVHWRFAVSPAGMHQVLIAALYSSHAGAQKKAGQEINFSTKLFKEALAEAKIRHKKVFVDGCFWCGEAKFSQLKGVLKVTSGYTGGHVADPGYEQVCTGTTGHAEAITIFFDPSVITYDELVEAFFLSHDPTQLNRQGNDVGTQYRSAIFYHNDYQRQKAEYYVRELTDKKIYAQPIVTEITPFSVFYAAEKYHQEYYKKHPERGYCRYVIQPQLEKFKHIFKDKLKQ